MRKNHLSPDWISAIATSVIAIVTVSGAMIVIPDILKSRSRAVENHLTWIEITPTNFLSEGERDPKDSTSTFWDLQIQSQNLGRETAFVHIKDWSIKSDKRGLIPKEAFPQQELKFTLQPGERTTWLIRFVMNPNYHILALRSGEDVLEIWFQFISLDMTGKEECNYTAIWKYTKGRFSLAQDKREYHNKEQ